MMINSLDGKLPLDKFGNIDWLKFEEDGVTKPLASIPGADEALAGKEKKRHKSLIIFTPKSEDVMSVPFSHIQHTSRLECASCHPGHIPGRRLTATTSPWPGLPRGSSAARAMVRLEASHFSTARNVTTCRQMRFPQGALIRK